MLYNDKIFDKGGHGYDLAIADLYNVYHYDSLLEQISDINEIAEYLKMYFEIEEHKAKDIFIPDTMPNYQDTIFLKSISPLIDKVVLEEVIYGFDGYNIYIYKPNYENSITYPSNYTLNEYNSTNHEITLSVYILKEMTTIEKIVMVYDIIDRAISNVLRDNNIYVNRILNRINNIYKPLTLINTKMIEPQTSVFIGLYYYTLYKLIRKVFPSITFYEFLEAERACYILKVIDTKCTEYIFNYNKDEHGGFNDMYLYIQNEFYSVKGEEK